MINNFLIEESKGKKNDNIKSVNITPSKSENKKDSINFNGRDKILNTRNKPESKANSNKIINNDDNKILFTYQYILSKKQFQPINSNCNEIENLTKGTINFKDIKGYLYEVSKLLANAYYDKKVNDKVVLSLKMYLLVLLSVIFMIIFSLFLIFSVEYEEQTTVNDPATEQILKSNNISNFLIQNIYDLNFTEVNNSEILTYETDSQVILLVNKTFTLNASSKSAYIEDLNIISKKLLNLSDVLSGFSKNIAKNSKTEVKKGGVIEVIIDNSNSTNTTNTNNSGNSVANQTYYIISIIFGVLSLVLIYILLVYNFIEKPPRLLNINDIAKNKIKQIISNLNNKYKNYETVQFNYHEFERIFEVVYYNDSTSFSSTVNSNKGFYKID